MVRDKNGFHVCDMCHRHEFDLDELETMNTEYNRIIQRDICSTCLEKEFRCLTDDAAKEAREIYIKNESKWERLKKQLKEKYDRKEIDFSTYYKEHEELEESQLDEQLEAYQCIV